MKNFKLLGCFIFLIGCSDNNANYVSTSPQNNQQSLPKPISEYAYNSYSKSQFPTLYKEWGSNWVKKISEVEKAAVHKIANEQNACDSIEEAGISTAKSTPKKEIVIFVNCANNQQFYVSDQDVLTNNKSLSNSENSIDYETATERCKTLIKLKAELPASVKYGKIETSKYDMNGNVIVKVPFSVQNYLGAELPYVAKCLFTPDGKEEFSIIE